MSDYLTVDQILDADDLPAEDMDIPEWGGKIKVRGLTGTERDRMEFVLAEARKNPETANIRAQLVGRCIVKSDGSRMFDDKKIAALGEKSGAVIDRIFDKVRELSGTKDGQVEDAAEDFGDAPTDDSRSV